MSVEWSNGFAYPLNFWVWRLRQLMQTFISLSVWVAVYAGGQTSLGYTSSEMITYIFMANFINYVILASQTVHIVSIINSGDLSLYLVKPVNFFYSWFVRDIADKLQNILFSVGELGLLYLLFRPELQIPQTWTIVGLLIASAGLGMVLYFFINMIFGFIGFWSPDAWAPRFLFHTVMSFAAGMMFPIDILPPVIERILSLTPFPYLTYFQTKVWLGQLSYEQLAQGFGVMGVWIVLTYFAMMLMWRKGIRSYGAEGR